MSAEKSAWIVDVTEATFEREVIERSKSVPVVVDFWAEWCGPCLALGPVLERLVEERAGQIVLAKVNVDECQGLASAFAIQSIPAVKAIRDAQIVLEFIGLRREPELRQFLDQLSPSEETQRIQQAHALEATDPAQAEALYRPAVQGERPPTEAVLGLARLLIARGEIAEAADWLRRVPPGGEEAAEVERLSTILFLKERAREFGDESTLRQRLAPDAENAEVRYQLGCVLAAAGTYPAALEMLLSAAERDKKIGSDKVREVMVKVFTILGVRSELSDEYRDKLRVVLY